MPQDKPRQWESDDEPRRRKPSNKSLWITLAIVGGVVGVILVGCLGVVGYGYWMASGPSRENDAINRKGAALRDSRQIMTREEFKSKVLQRTPEEVIGAVGKPDTTQEGTGRDQTWYYQRMTIDPITSKTDVSAQVIFENGRVVRINF